MEFEGGLTINNKRPVRTRRQYHVNHKSYLSGNIILSFPEFGLVLHLLPHHVQSPTQGRELTLFPVQTWWMQSALIINQSYCILCKYAAGWRQTAMPIPKLWSKAQKGCSKWWTIKDCKINFLFEQSIKLSRTHLHTSQIAFFPYYRDALSKTQGLVLRLSDTKCVSVCKIQKAGLK